MARRVAIVLGITLVVAFLLIPTASADFGRVYKWRYLLGPFSSTSDYVYHNHTYNDVYFSPGATYPSRLFEVTPQGAKHYEKYGYGNISNSHPGVYYTAPYCGNQDGVSHYVDCSAAWG
jgi:hypothetical protein